MNITKVVVLSVLIGAIVTLLGVVTFGSVDVDSLLARAEASGGGHSISCPLSSGNFDELVSFLDNGQGEVLLADSSLSRAQTDPINVSLDAGEYRVTLVSYDDHSNKPNQNQPDERYFLKLIAGNTTVVETNSISDLPDHLNYRTQTVHNDLALNQSIDSVIAFHSGYPDHNPNSIVPVCAGFEKVNNTPDLTGSCTASASDVEIGENVTFTANVSGGTGSYTYSWTGSENLTGSNSSVTKSYSAIGTKTATVEITSGNQTIEKTCDVEVKQDNNNTFTGSCSASKSDLETGESVTFTANASGGTGSFTYSWSGSENLSGSNQSVSKSYSSEGSKSATVQITSGNETIERTCQVVVDNDDNVCTNCGGGGKKLPPHDPDDDDLRVSCDVDPEDVLLGEEVEWSADVRGGDEDDYEFEWSGTDGLDGDEESVEKRYFTSGRKTATVTVTDGDDEDSATCRIDIPAPEVDGVTLTQVPYTGPGDTAKLALSLLALMAWSGAIGYVYIRRKTSAGEVMVGIPNDIR